MSPRLLTAALLLSLALPCAPLAAQDASVISGRVLRAGTGEPVADVILRVRGSDASAVSDAAGRFVLRGLPVGSHTLEVRHPTHGDHAVGLAVSRAEERFEVVVHLGAEGISVEIVGATMAPSAAPPRDAEAAAGGAATLPTVTVREDVTVAPPSAPALRAGALVDRAAILRLSGSSRNLSDLLRRAVPTLYVRPSEGSTGALLCLEFRGAQVRSMNPATSSGTCNHPQIYLDGVPLIDPAPAYGITNFDAIEWIQAIPPAEAGPQFGGAPYGVILVTTSAGRRAAAGTGNPSVMARSRNATFDWERDPAGHPFWRALALSAMGNAAGLLAGREVGAAVCTWTTSPGSWSAPARAPRWRRWAPWPWPSPRPEARSAHTGGDGRAPPRDAGSPPCSAPPWRSSRGTDSPWPRWARAWRPPTPPEWWSWWPARPS